MKQAVACLEILAVSIGNESKERELDTSKANLSTHLSPYTRCLLRLGLRPGVLSLCLPAFSISFNLRFKASASMASVARWTALMVSGLSSSRLLEIVGGVLEPTGVGREGVVGRSVSLIMLEGLWSSVMVTGRLLTRGRDRAE